MFATEMVREDQDTCEIFWELAARIGTCAFLRVGGCCSIVVHDKLAHIRVLSLWEFQHHLDNWISFHSFQRSIEHFHPFVSVIPVYYILLFLFFYLLLEFDCLFLFLCPFLYLITELKLIDGEHK